MEVKIVIDGTAYEFEHYLGLREFLEKWADKVSETTDDNGVYC